MPTIEANGIRLAYQGQGQGQPLLLISGVGYGQWYWRRLAPALARRCRVITFDNRGAGDSDKPPGPYTSQIMAADTIALIEGLGLGPATVFGHSLGGFVAQELALARPDLVSRLILAATSHGGPNAIPVTPEALAVLTQRDGDPVELFRRGMAVSTGPGFVERHPTMIAELLEYRMSVPVPPDAYAAQVAVGLSHNAEERLVAITCPTLILTGAEDRVVPPENAMLLAGRIPGAQVITLAGLGHHFPIEAPDRTCEVIEAFVKEN